MKAAILSAFGEPLSIQDRPSPVPGAGEVVVSVVAAPVLSYAAQVFDGSRQYHLDLPVVPGCGAIGQIAQVGADATRLKAGEWVFCGPVVRSRDDPVMPDTLLQGWIASGEGAERLHAHFHDGPFAEQVLVPMESVTPIGEIDPSDVPQWCALNTLLVPYGGWLAAGLQPGETVLVSGATGHFGSAGVAVALEMGAACVIAPGRERERLDNLVNRFGLRVRPVEIGSKDDTRRMKEAASGPIDRLLDMLPPLTDAAPTRTAIMAVRPYGTAVVMSGVKAEICLPYGYLMSNCLTVRGQYMYPRDAPRRLIALIRAGLLSLDLFEVHSFDLVNVNDAVQNASKSAGPFKMTVVTPRSLAPSAR
jgi:alcohol dehydrogenase